MAMPDARSVAMRFAAKFLEQGNYYYASSARGPSSQPLQPASVTRKIDTFFEEVGFEGLAIQSVGYEEGAEVPKVHVYVTKGSRRTPLRLCLMTMGMCRLK